MSCSTDLTVLRESDLVAVTVTYHPDLLLLGAQQASLAGIRSVIVDNGSGKAAVDAMKALANESSDRLLVLLATNIGLAGGLNAGINEARRLGARAVLLLDQDSTFHSGMPRLLLAALNDAQAATGRLACVGPALVDVTTGASHGFHHIVGGWRWAQISPAAVSAAIFPVDNLNGSGTMMSMALVDEIGPLDEGLFIDHIDTDWSFRVRHGGYGLFGVPSISMDHRMGEAGRRIWLLGWRVWPERSPRRHYYLFRNTIILMGRAYVPAVWKMWAFFKLVLMIIVSGAEARRVDHWRMMCHGWRDARTGRKGVAP